MDYLYLKALHIIFVVTWFSGLFYIVRLYVYHCEVQEKPEQVQAAFIEQYQLMEKRLWYGITWPSAVLTTIFGTSMLVHFMPLTDHPWLQVKLGLLLLLFVYHFSCGYIRKKLLNTPTAYTSMQMRVWNEVPTLLLFSIVFLAILKDTLKMGVGLVSLISLSMLLVMGIRFYKKLRST